MTKQTPKQIAAEILATANRLGWSIEINSDGYDPILTIRKSFTPGDMDAFVEADGTYYDVIGRLPRTTSGSDWGTDGSGIGGHVALKSGRFTYNRSGGSRRVISQLAKLI
jgi:hypothetical protein